MHSLRVNVCTPTRVQGKGTFAGCMLVAGGDAAGGRNVYSSATSLISNFVVHFHLFSSFLHKCYKFNNLVMGVLIRPVPIAFHHLMN